MENPQLHHLPRLDRLFYQAFAAVHWTLRVEPLVAGWLNDRFHFEFRELLLHACTREKLFCPAYCLMPDHLHLVWLGVSLASDQLNGMKFLRLHLNRLLSGEALSALDSKCSERPWRLGPQAHDHVLREKERKRNAFATACFYVLANPVRAGLVPREQEWPYLGAVVPGYPDLHPLREGYWELFWKLYERFREPTPVELRKPN